MGTSAWTPVGCSWPEKSPTFQGTGLWVWPDGPVVPRGAWGQWLSQEPIHPCAHEHAV